MIATNRVASAVAVCFAFWYCLLAIASMATGTTITEMALYLPLSLAFMAAGAIAGAALTVLFGSGFAALKEYELKEGIKHREVRISLGGLPSLPVTPSATAPGQILASQPWWEFVQGKSPAHAAAIKAVLDAMYVEPRLPASPYPGGHAGRTLIEHSLAVVDFMLQAANTWVYEGQRDKRGNMRVPLSNPGQPHRFTLADAPLLILTAFAHDIGKLACYKPIPGGNPEDHTVQVIEVLPNHDAEGAHLLRHIPEVMALPYDDRTALITAVGYYHHPFGLPIAGWLNDRIRSLTELLAHADILTGEAEGHTLKGPAMTYQDEEDGAPATQAATPLPAQDQEGDAVDDDAILHAMMAQNQGKLRKEKRTGGITAAHAATAATVDANLPRELGLFMTAIRKPNAINGKRPEDRVAWKHGDFVYVMDKLMRTLITNTNPDLRQWLADATADNNGNASKFTAALATQLAERGGLCTVYEGRAFTPSRALFKMLSPSGKSSIPVLVIPTSFIPGADAIPDASLPVTLTGPLWGAKQGKAAAIEPAAQGMSAQDAEEVAEDARPANHHIAPSDEAQLKLPIIPPVDGFTLSEQPVQAEPGAVEQPAEPIMPGSDESQLDFEFAGLDPVDFPMDLPPLEELAAANLQTQEMSTEPQPVPEAEPQPEALTIEPQAAATQPEPPSPSCEAADATLSLIQGLVFDPDVPMAYEQREKNGKQYAVITTTSPSGISLANLLADMEQEGRDVSRIKTARLKDTGERAYIIPMP